jgi:hypothetical protein
MIIADGHVHFYDCFEPIPFLSYALANFKRAQPGWETGTGELPILFLADTPQQPGFARLQALIQKPVPSGYPHQAVLRIEETGEIESLQALLPGVGGLYVIGGKQIQTRERLEVLALGTLAPFREGLPLEDLLPLIASANGIPVIPWGFGKWLGSRGALIKRILRAEGRPHFFLGDSRNRPQGWPRPPLFQEARDRGILILSGSDPLAFSSEVNAPGSYGFILPDAIDPQRPARDIKIILESRNTSLKSFGTRKNWVSFAESQARLLWQR